MKDQQERLNYILEKLRERKFRITPQRVAILKVFLSSDEHPSVERVYEQVLVNFPTTSMATVYKTVSLLKEIGEILEIGIADGSNRYDGRKPYPHPHVICTQCKKIVDPEVHTLDQLSEEISDASGYRIDSHQLDFFGVCPACQKSKARA